jgi:hypothetical protein
MVLSITILKMTMLVIMTPNVAPLSRTILFKMTLDITIQSQNATQKNDTHQINNQHNYMNKLTVSITILYNLTLNNASMSKANHL